MSSIQPIHLTYGFLSGDNGQDVTVVDPAVGGPGLQVFFSKDNEDPNGHHGNAGGISIINGPSAPAGSAGYDVKAEVAFWIADLWAPPGYSTEIQMWFSMCEVLSDGSSGATVWTGPSREKQAPPQHDALVWDANGDLLRDGPDHRRSNFHTGRTGQMFVPRNRRLRAHAAQMHDNAFLPTAMKTEFLADQPTLLAMNLPWPGYVRKAWADLEAVPR